MDLLEEVVDFLFDGYVSPSEISKAGPDSSEVHVPGNVKAYKKKKREVNIGLANNAFGAAAGAAATKLAYDQVKGGINPKTMTWNQDKPKPSKVGLALKKLKVSPKKTAVIAGGALVGSQLVNAALDAQSTQYFARERVNMKPPKQKIKKSDRELAIYEAIIKDINPRLDDTTDLTWSGEFSKVDTDKRQVFGWCSLTTVDGEPVVDRQGDYIPLDEVEKSAYNYVIHSRKGGDMHKRDGELPLHTSDLIESFVVTPEKLEKLGIDSNAVPHGWWVGFKINDDKQWEDVKKGDRAHFSIHGKGRRVEKSL
jgi:hypothetical protein